MNNRKISIITSLYRCTEFLEPYLYHLSRISNLADCELILVHNDPLDEELKILNQFNWQGIVKKHLKVPREGLYASWNRGIKEAAGEYIAIWNVDDIRTPGSLLAQMQAMEKSSAVLCYGDFYGTNNYGETQERFYQYKPYEVFKKDTFRRHIIGCFPMWRKNIHQQIGYFDEQFKLVSDYEFQLRVASNYDLVKTETVLGYYLEYAGHKLSSNRRLQHKERTVVEIRYRIYDKIMLHILPFIGNYNKDKMLNFGNWVEITNVVPVLKMVHVKNVFSFVLMPFSYSFWFARRSLSVLYRYIFQ